MSLEDLKRIAELEGQVETLELRITRLRKAVNWLRGANHDAGINPQDNIQHVGNVEDCPAWECQRARDIVNEGRDPCSICGDDCKRPSMHSR